ncbi:MAG: peptide chain release factor N(5)-glutamine methyltransferase [Prevotella sp.]|nr:peptide chain release factor N(5)-glutamine methyltransferase [Candidatus Prevotella equi]
MTTLRTLAQQLDNYDIHESQSIIRTLLEDSFGLSYTEICCGAIDNISDSDKQRLQTMMSRLCNGEPVQYVTGKTFFFGREFHVRQGVLIPRPETEELCEWIIDSSKDHSACSILDIGTGSGCIAITLASEKPDADVTAWDISNEALNIAMENARNNNCHVSFIHADALNAPMTDNAMYDIIVSNPPYICNKEAKEMERNVLEHEPHIALFVEDDTPLLFYKSIAEYAAHALKHNGMLFFEINPLYADETAEMMRAINFRDIEIRKDQFGKDRMIKAIKGNYGTQHD